MGIESYLHPSRLPRTEKRRNLCGVEAEEGRRGCVSLLHGNIYALARTHAHKHVVSVRVHAHYLIASLLHGDAIPEAKSHDLKRIEGELRRGAPCSLLNLAQCCC